MSINKNLADWLDSDEAKALHDKMAALQNGSFWTRATQDPIRDLVTDVADVAVIHKDFRSVADRLLKEAKEIIEHARPDERAERYRKLGFTGTQRVKDHEGAMIAKKEQEELMQTLLDYKVRYPLYQFLDEKSLRELCRKYTLVYAPAQYFLGEIPEENLRDLEAFEVKDPMYRFVIQNSYRDEIIYSSIEKAYEGQGKNKKEVKSELVGFDVVATEDMFELPPDLEFDVQNHGVRAKVKDPLVLQRVPKGFLIITAWGPEAELPEVNVDKQ